MIARIFAFKSGTSKTYRKQEGILFYLNGQTQGYIKANFFARKAVGLQRIAADLLVLLDCSSFSPIEQDDIFMPSRDRLVEDNAFANEIEEKLEKALKNHPGLRDLKHRRAVMDAQQELANDEILKQKIKDVVRNFPAIAQFFGRDKALPNMPKVKQDETKKSNRVFSGEKHPTYFRFAGKDQGAVLERDVHIGRQSRIAFDTDAADNYFDRRIDAGRMSVEQTVDGEKCVVTSYIHYLVVSKCSVYLDLPGGVRVGDKLDFTFTVRDPATYKVFEKHARLRVRSEAEVRPGPQRRRKRGEDEAGSGSQGNVGIRMPEVRWLRRGQDAWAAHFGTEEECLHIVVDVEDRSGVEEARYEFYLNEENSVFKVELLSAKVPQAVIKKQFEVGMVLVGLSLIHDNRQGAGSEREHGGKNGGWEFESIVKMVSRAVAPVILPMVQGLGKWGEDLVDGSDLDGEAR